MSSTRLVETVLSLGSHINDSEFRLLMLLAECPDGERYKASFEYLLDEGDFTENRIEQIVWNFDNGHRFDFFIIEADMGRSSFHPFELYYTVEDTTYLGLEWK